MTFPQVVAVTPSSPADLVGVLVGDELRSVNGIAPKDIIEYRLLTDEDVVALEIGRGGIEMSVEITKHAGEPLGIEVSSPVFDRVRTCDNHCAFCFIYQLPKGLRRSLYVKDDDYRLSFLYGNFTTLTRFTELDLERIITEKLSPLHVSIHATDPEVRAAMLKNRRGAMSLRWLRHLLDNDIAVHGQVVCCPGVNDGAVLSGTLAGILDRFPELSSVGVVPLGVSRFSREPTMRAHTKDEAIAVVDLVEQWQERFRRALGRPLVHAADEYYVLSGRPFPSADNYDGYPQHENGVGMARSFAEEFRLGISQPRVETGGFFASIDGAPAFGYRAPRIGDQSGDSADFSAPITIVTGRYGERVLRPILDEHGYKTVEVLGVDNAFFGGNIAVAGLLAGADVAAALEGVPAAHRVLLPDVCLSNGQFLDAMNVSELGRTIEVVPCDGASLRQALEGSTSTTTAMVHASGVLQIAGHR